MASKLQIHTPYVLTTLATPYGTGRHVAGEVFGQKQGLKRRKRSEVAVAIDGVAVCIYDVLSSQPVTNHNVTIETVFTCPPYSLRWRPSLGKSACRYTYVSTTTSKERQITLLKNELSADGTSTLSSLSHTPRGKTPIVHLCAGAAQTSQHSLPSDELPNHEIIAVASDGTIIGLDGETLDEKWSSAPAILAQKLASSSASRLQVDFVQATTAADVIEGLFGGKNELSGVFQDNINREGFNPDILLIITSSTTPEGATQQDLHILALLSGRQAQSIFVMRLPSFPGSTKYQLDARSGTLQTLVDGLLSSYTFSSGSPHLETRLQIPGMASFLRISKSSVLAATPETFSVYNPIFRSLQAATPVDSEGECQLISYFGAREIAVGLRGSSLVAVQVEAPKNRNSKRRAEGLLTDAIRRGLPREQSGTKRIRGEHQASAVLERALPGVLSDTSSAEFQNGVAKADELLSAKDLRAWEELMAGTFKVQIKSTEVQETASTATNGVVANIHLPEWIWPSSRADYAQVDRRWVFYAISKVFTWTQPAADSGEPRLACPLAASSVLNYLVDAGHLSTSNIKSAFKEETCELDNADDIIASEMPPLLAQIDPTMALLLGYLSGTQLGSTELVSAVKLLLHSLGLFETPSNLGQKRLLDAAAEGGDEETDAIKMELDKAEEELQITEVHLSGHRFRGLGVAFGKLAACPAVTTVQSLRRLFRPEEIIGLLNVLRAELIKDGWTSDYLEEIEAPPDGSLQLIADLMTRCIDAVGLGGWMAFDSVLASSARNEDTSDYFGRFNLEISSALQGINDSIQLQSMLAEATSYAKRARRALIEAGKGMPTTVHFTEQLPLGLKTDVKISTERIRSGGEIVQRSSRDIGQAISRRRAVYSLQRIPEELLLGVKGSRETVVQEAK
ncbi:hypothetical protein QBC40DRAFT_96803 [Triangularia verruculosa]|uniref:Uncharacterized protein n=1 Tax=Triangularia verruculosa TaxID=2587418 RepID=A0AAN6XD08_9PEZI|nr:hypothetical protein QBC40DRAFT_96803 [Triangularia verruculosa]